MASTAVTPNLIHGSVMDRPLKAGETYSSITIVKGATNLANQTNQWFALLKWVGSNNFEVLRATVDDTTAAWADTTSKTLSLSEPYTPTEDTAAYLAVCMVTSSGSTGVTVVAAPGYTPVQRSITPPITLRSQLQNYTTPLADGTTIQRNTSAGGSQPLIYGWVS